MQKKLYQLDSGERIRSWEIEVLHWNNFSDIVIRTGLLDGAKVETKTSVTEGKNIGKSNETSHIQQAVLEAQSKIDAQIKKGYVEDIKNLKKSTELGSGMPSPMLAHKYCKDGSQKGSKTLAQLGIKGKKIFIQPKLDGNRCTIKIENKKAVMYTGRNGEIMPVQLSQIINDVESKVKTDDLIYLDGELYTNKFSFNKLNGLIKKVKASKEDIENRKHIKFHLYDSMMETGYENRYSFIQEFETDNIVLIDNYEIIATEENIQEYLEKFLALGFEGLMIRQLGLPYEHKRTWQLCKVKVFVDEEYKLIGFEEDVRKGFVGSFVMMDKEGRTFNAGASGQSEEEREYMWNNQKEFLNKMATVCYFGLSEYGVPRFGKFKGIRE